MSSQNHEEWVTGNELWQNQKIIGKCQGLPAVEHSLDRHERPFRALYTDGLFFSKVALLAGSHAFAADAS